MVKQVKAYLTHIRPTHLGPTLAPAAYRIQSHTKNKGDVQYNVGKEKTTRKRCREPPGCDAHCKIIIIIIFSCS